MNEGSEAVTLQKSRRCGKAATSRVRRSATFPRKFLFLLLATALLAVTATAQLPSTGSGSDQSPDTSQDEQRTRPQALPNAPGRSSAIPGSADTTFEPAIPAEANGVLT